jgi:cytochrome b561
MNDTREQLSPLSVGLHWLIGLTMIGMVIFGLVLEDMHPADAAGKASKSYLIGLHVSIGVLVLVFATWRLARRIRLGLPEHVGIYKAWELGLAKAIHYFLLFATLAMPISGIVMTIGRARPVEFFGLPLIPKLLAEKNVLLTNAGGATHAILGKLILLAVALHIAGALKHHIVDRDGTLRRMLGARIEPTKHA